MDEQQEPGVEHLPPSAEWVETVQAGIDRMKAKWAETHPGSFDGIAGKTDEQIDAMMIDAFRQRYPGSMLCGAAHFAREVWQLGETMDAAGAPAEAFCMAVRSLAIGALTAHVGHHDIIVGSQLGHN